MTSKKNMSTNRTPRRIHRNKGGRKKGPLDNKNIKPRRRLKGEPDDAMINWSKEKVFNG